MGMMDVGTDVLNRGAVAGLLGMPVDIATLLLRPLGYQTQAPVGGSEWIGQQMQDAGMVSATRRPLAEMAASLVSPAGVAGAATKAPRIARGLLEAGRSDSVSPLMSSRNVKIRAPEPLTQRPFSDDYQVAPGGAASGERLAFDIEGRPLDPGATVFGRRSVGGLDEALESGGADRIAGQLGVSVSREAARDIGGDAGRFSTIPGTILDPRIQLRRDLSPEQSRRVFEHEVGHAIDKISGEMSSAGVSKQLQHIYDFLNNPHGQSVAPRATKKQWSPAADRYKPAEFRDELWAEAVRLYMLDPNAIKTIAPDVAAIIRKRVNTHPTVSKVVQFNSAAGAAGVGGLLSMQVDGDGN